MLINSHLLPCIATKVCINMGRRGSLKHFPHSFNSDCVVQHIARFGFFPLSPYDPNNKMSKNDNVFQFHLLLCSL